jgi:hypothetical protein
MKTSGESAGCKADCVQANCNLLEKQGDKRLETAKGQD